MVSLDFTSVSPEKQPNTLSIAEQTTLAEHERVIERGLKTFYEVGNALIQIRDNRLYRQGFKTFEDYCLSRWQIKQSHVYRLIDSVKVVDRIESSPIGGTLPKLENERQVRALSKFDDDLQPAIVKLAASTANSLNVPFSAGLIERTGNVLIETIASGCVDTGSGESTPLTAALTKTEEEAYKRSVQYMHDKVKDKITHVSHNSGVNEWYTPPEYIDAAKDVLGTIDLDPASSEIANQLVKATTFYTAEDDGLSFEWQGKVWMNPPYASELIGRFAAKFARHVQQRDITMGIVLVNNATETVWFSDLVSVASAVVFTKGRVKFLDPEGNPGAPLQGQALIYFGYNPSWFLEVFSKFGWGATL